MFVSTQAIGILEWSANGWKRITTNGLLESTGFEPLKDLYVPIPSFEIFKGKLLVAYGSPGYAPYTIKFMYLSTRYR